MKRYIITMPIVLMLGACGAPSVEDLIEDPSKLSEIMQECQMKQMQGKDTTTEECSNAKEASQRMAKNMMNGLMKDIKNSMGR